MIVHRASEYGRCIRASVADRLGYRALPAPDVLEAAYARGNEHEEVCDDAMIALGYGITDRQMEVSFPITDDVQLDGHLDGVVFGPAVFDVTRRVWEAKAPNVWEKFERAVRTDTWDALTTRYAWQTSLYMVTMDMECLVACWDETRGVRTFVIEEPIFSRERIVARVCAIEAIVDNGTLPTECPAVEFDDWSCPFRYLHLREDDEVDEELDRLVFMRENERTKRGFIDAQIKVLDELIGKQLGERESVSTLRSKVTRYTQTTETPDRDKMKAAGLWTPEYVKTTTSDRLKVTLRKDADVPTE